MRKYFLSIVALVGMLFATSCQESLVEPQVGGTTTFTVQVPNQMGTKAIGGHDLVNKLYVEVYAQGDIENVIYKTTADKKQDGSFEVSINLIQDQHYSIIFWAQKEGAYIVENLRSIPMNVNHHNNESGAAFYAYLGDFVPSGTTQTVTLKRPFAQLNLGTTPASLKTDVQSDSLELSKSYIKVGKIAQSFNTIKGYGEGSQEEVMFSLADVPDEKLYVAGEKYYYVSMDYLPIEGDNEALVTVNAVINLGNGQSISHNFTNVPVKENYRTNIVGNLISSTTDFKVEVNDDWAGEDYNVNVWDGKSIEIPSYDDATETYSISNGSQLAWLAATVSGDPLTRSENEPNSLAGKTVKLTDDIYLGENEWKPIGMGGKHFEGIFDGQGYTIYGLKVASRSSKPQAALFCSAAGNAQFKNFTIDGAKIIYPEDGDDYYAAGVVGTIYGNLTFENITVKNSRITGNNKVAGLIAHDGTSTQITIKNCHILDSYIASEDLKDGGCVGGMIGYYATGVSGKENSISNSSVKGCTIVGVNSSNSGKRANSQFIGSILTKDAMVLNITDCILEDNTFTQTINGTNPVTYQSAFIPQYIGGDRQEKTLGTINITFDGKNVIADGVAQDAVGNYYISNAAGLRWVASVVNTTTAYTPTLFDNKTVYLVNDVDLKNEEWIPIGDERFARTAFKGVFDGQGNTVRNVRITKKTIKHDENKSAYGLFGNLGGTLKNLTVENVSISGTPKFIGALVGRYSGALIENCHVKNSSVTCNNWTIGGIVGQWNEGVIYNCSIENSTIEGYAGVGAIVGLALNAGERTIEKCSVSNCTIKKNGSFGGDYDKMFGSILGALYNGSLDVKINECSSENTNLVVNGESKSLPLCGFITTGDKLSIDGKVAVSTAEELTAAIKAGGSYIMMNDIAMTEAIYKNIDFTLDGNGYTISQAEGSTNNYALFDSVTGEITLKNVNFAGIKGGAVLRTVGAETTIENVTIQDAETTQQQGLLRLMGKSTIKNSTFKNNTCNMVISLNYDGANNDPQVVENCVFESNICNATAVLYYVKGAGATINGNRFIGNTVYCNGNGATVYMGFTENNTVTNNLFQNNTVNEASESSRVGGAIFFGYETVFTGNAFVGNKVTGENAKGNDVCVSTYYTSIDLSGNYWGGNAPVEDTNYFVQHKSDERVVIIDNYLTENPIK